MKATTHKRLAVLTEPHHARLLEAIRAGATVGAACGYAGIGERTYHDSIARARAGDERYATWLQEVESAEAACVVGSLAVIRKAAVGGQWQAAAWILERRFGYVRRDESHVRAHVSTDGLDLSKLTDRELAAYEAAVRKAERVRTDDDGPED